MCNPFIVGVEGPAYSFDEPIEVVLIENLIQSVENGWAALRGRSWVATHIDTCLACRRRLPIAMCDSMVCGIDPVDPDFTSEAAHE
jgi:hypothetical protein